MYPGLIDNAQLVDDTLKIVIIDDKEPAGLNIDIAHVQETYLADSGTIRESNYIFFWQGLSQDEPW